MRLKLFHWPLFLAAVFIAGCSVPNLESPQCRSARDTVKKFYSIHFASQLPGSKDALAGSEMFLTDRLLAERSKGPEDEIEYFTRSANFPTAFRIGSCESESDSEATVQIVLLWRDDNRSDQAEVRARVVNDKAGWLIDKVTE